MTIKHFPQQEVKRLDTLASKLPSDMVQKEYLKTKRNFNSLPNKK